jgi:histidyl-tRNA synthetase
MKYSSVRGTRDFGPSESRSFDLLAQKARKALELFGYQEVMLPVLEEEGVFRRAVGESSDIVEKQMFKIQDKEIVLRPEGTAQMVRYFVENNLNNQGDFWKFFYIGAMFRGERPQKGRLRQFHQIGAEVFGAQGVFIEAETIKLALKILADCGVTGVKVKLNSLGCSQDKENFNKALKEKLSAKKDSLCEDCKRRLDKNSLRILDCKNPVCKEICAQIDLSDNLCQDCKQRFTQLREILDQQKIDYVYDPHLVRGLDYYTGVVFEITSEALGSQDAIGAGGRYNNLVKTMEGPDVPAIGFALGIERMMLALGEGKADSLKLSVYLAVVNPELSKEAFKIIAELRLKGIACDMDYCAKSLKGQFRYAQKNNVPFVAILGDDEFKEGCIMLKNMASGEQEKIKIEELYKRVKVAEGQVAD